MFGNDFRNITITISQFHSCFRGSPLTGRVACDRFLLNSVFVFNPPMISVLPDNALRRAPEGFDSVQIVQHPFFCFVVPETFWPVDLQTLLETFCVTQS
jgi:hypothetical protein